MQNLLSIQWIVYIWRWSWTLQRIEAHSESETLHLSNYICSTELKLLFISNIPQRCHPYQILLPEFSVPAGGHSQNKCELQRDIKIAFRLSSFDICKPLVRFLQKKYFCTGMIYLFELFPFAKSLLVRCRSC